MEAVERGILGSVIDLRLPQVQIPTRVGIPTQVIKLLRWTGHNTLGTGPGRARGDTILPAHVGREVVGVHAYLEEFGAESLALGTVHVVVVEVTVGIDDVGFHRLGASWCTRFAGFTASRTLFDLRRCNKNQRLELDVS